MKIIDSYYLLNNLFIKNMHLYFEMRCKSTVFL